MRNTQACLQVHPYFFYANQGTRGEAAGCGGEAGDGNGKKIAKTGLKKISQLEQCEESCGADFMKHLWRPISEGETPIRPNVSNGPNRQ